MAINEQYGYSNIDRSWWVLLVRGLAAILFGILAFAWPGLTFTALVLLFGAFALWDGIFATVEAFRTPGDRRWTHALVGLSGLLAAAFVFLVPELAMAAALFVIAGWAIATGLLQIVAGVKLRKIIEGEWMLFAGGSLSILFGVAVALRPAAGIVAVSWTIGVYAAAFGILLTMLAFRLRRWDRARDRSERSLRQAS